MGNIRTGRKGRHYCQEGVSSKAFKFKLVSGFQRMVRLHQIQRCRFMQTP